MIQKSRQYRFLTTNLFWFSASLLLAFMVWVIATSGTIQERRFNTVAVQVEYDPGLLVTDVSVRTVRVTVRAQQSVLGLLTQDDVRVRADLHGRGPGVHDVTLRVDVARRAFADTQPRQITVTLEEIQTKFVEIRPVITQDLPAGFQREAPTFSVTEVQVSGAASRVQQVAAARVTLNLADQRTTFERDLSLTAIDAQGNEVTGITLEPQTIRVTVPITQRNDVREVSIRPDIDTNSLPDGYNLLSPLVYSPQTMFVSGDLTLLPDILFTEPISLADRTSSFEVSVPVVLPDDNLFILGEPNVLVTVNIAPRILTRQFNNIPVTILGLGTGLEAQLVTSRVTVLVTGPQVELELLEEDDIRVVIDLNGLTPNTYELVPLVSNAQGQVQADNVSVLPSTISVTITQMAEATETPES